MRPIFSLGAHSRAPTHPAQALLVCMKEWLDEAMNDHGSSDEALADLMAEVEQLSLLSHDATRVLTMTVELTERAIARLRQEGGTTHHVATALRMTWHDAEKLGDVRGYLLDSICTAMKAGSASPESPAESVRRRSAFNSGEQPLDD